MEKKTLKKKLSLHRETIRLLDPDQLDPVVGGSGSCPSDACTRPQSICNSCGAGCTQLC